MKKEKNIEQEKTSLWSICDTVDQVRPLDLMMMTMMMIH